MSSEKALDNPFEIINQLFTNFNVLTLTLTVALLVLMFLLRSKLNKIPLIGIIVILGCLANYNHKFKSYSDLCDYPYDPTDPTAKVDCTFHVIDKNNFKEVVLS